MSRNLWIALVLLSQIPWYHSPHLWTAPNRSQNEVCPRLRLNLGKRSDFIFFNFKKMVILFWSLTVGFRTTNSFKNLQSKTEATVQKIISLIRRNKKNVPTPKICLFASDLIIILYYYNLAIYCFFFKFKTNLFYTIHDLASFFRTKHRE